VQLGNDKRAVFAWALYDWANSGFMTTVVAAFFPVFFKQYWSAETDVTISTLQLGFANSLASLFVALLSPALGAIADKGGAKRKFLLFFTVLGILNTGLLYYVPRGAWEAAVTLYALALVGFSGAIAFYDALILSVATRDNIHRVSALGFALGYLGGGLLLALNVLMVLMPERFGLKDADAAIRVSFITVALWWAAFSVPMFLWVAEPQAMAGSRGVLAVKAGLRELATTLRAVRRLRIVALFLAGYFLYIDGVDTVIRMAVDYGMALGFEPVNLIMALLVTQIVGVPAAGFAVP